MSILRVVSLTSTLSPLSSLPTDTLFLAKMSKVPLIFSAISLPTVSAFLTCGCQGIFGSHYQMQIAFHTHHLVSDAVYIQ